jgi:hypothetical protein
MQFHIRQEVGLSTLLFSLILFLFGFAAIGNTGSDNPILKGARHLLPARAVRNSVPVDTVKEWYHYRMLSVFYDSTQIDGIFGEVVVLEEIGSTDTTRVRFHDWFKDGIDSTLGFMNSVSATEPFRVGGMACLSFFRCLVMFYENADQHDLGVTDTIAWAVQLIKTTGERIATLDSIVVLPKPVGMGWPTLFPDSSSFASVYCNLTGYSFDPNDSAYLRIAMYRFGSGNPGYTVRDRIFARTKWSEVFTSGMGKVHAIGQQRSKSEKTPDVRIMLSPNPATTGFVVNLMLTEPSVFTLDIINQTGQKVGTLFSGTRGAGTHSFKFAVSDKVTSGIYYVLYRDNQTNQVVTTKAIIQ